jgi:thiol-disulfide isomerase/thioredoxin
MELYKNTDVQEIKIKDLNTKKKILIKPNINKKKFGILIFYSSDCKHCKEDVYLWSELANNFKKFNILAYNVYDFENKNEKIFEYMSIKQLPKIMNVTQKGTLYPFKDEAKYDDLFYKICKKLKI